ncbi:protein GAMETE EXPRESSED 3 isoform X1 [Phoenix dactylifera]|uniref:Protein GAMETE EXPRESSED 3 isoform X1 n=2 Tax=Phoenix dactylifera TaxID=42345 RepID=A0A8B8J9Q0_PHODC|nr:protein GAMETE EXPRESSED 3 isoform X1 [Phoenix dactylifera]
MMVSFKTNPRFFALLLLLLCCSSSIFSASFGFHEGGDGSITMATLGGMRDSQGNQNSIEIEELGRFAVQEHNKKENALLEFVRVVKAKEQVVAGALHHLTLEVMEAGKKKLYEVKVWVKPRLNFKELQEFKHLGDSSSVTSADRRVKRAEMPSVKTEKRLSNPLIRKDGRFIACSQKNLFAFEKNGTVAWVIPLHYECRTDITPVADERGKIYLIAEDRILQVIPSNIGTSEARVKIFFGQNSTVGGSGEIIGFSISILYSSLFVTVKNRGLFAILLHGELLWSAGPVLYRFGYRQGCKKNITDCYFSSAPIVDQCEGALYIANTEGQLYSLYIHSPHFRWIQDFSSVDKLLTITSGNNGHLYVIFPKKALVMALDVSTGNVLWQNNVGPLSTENCSPVVDSNGWMSVGSLDGFLYSFSPNGDLKKFLETTAPNSVIQVSPVADCSGFGVYISQTVMEGKSSRIIGNYTYISAMKPINIIFSLLAPATGTVYWTGKYPGELSSLLSKSHLRYFMLDERILLTFLSAGRIGNRLPCYTTGQKIAWTCSQAKPKFVSMDTGNERAILLFLFFQFAIIITLAGVVRFCCIFWRKKKLQDHGLGRFLEKRRSLHSKRKMFSKMISELEKKAAEDATTNEALDQLGEIVRAKEGVERKLSTSYSLGRDRIGSQRGSILPLYDGKTKSHSFHGSRKESVTIFNTISDTSTSVESSSGSDYSSNSSSRKEEHGHSYGEMKSATKAKAVVEAGSLSRIFTPGGDCGEESSDFTEGSRVFMNPMFIEHRIDSNVHSTGEGLMMEPMQVGMGRRTWLKRRRTLSSTN